MPSEPCGNPEAVSAPVPFVEHAWVLRLVSPKASSAFTQAPDLYVYGLRVHVYVPPTIYTTQPMGLGHPSKASHSQCRHGPKSGVSSWLKIFLTANLFTRTHSVRVPALSAGAGGSSTFVHAVSQQVLKQAEIQSFIGNQVLPTPFVATCQTLPRVSLSQTPARFVSFRYPMSV